MSHLVTTNVDDYLTYIHLFQQTDIYTQRLSAMTVLHTSLLCLILGPYLEHVAINWLNE